MFAPRRFRSRAAAEKDRLSAEEFAYVSINDGEAELVEAIQASRVLTGGRLASGAHGPPPHRCL